MKRTGIASLPLHGGKAPRWLMMLMTRLSREIVRVMAEEFGPREVLVRLSDPHWFQAFGCVLGFDWHSSGVTTTVCGALKEGLKGIDKEIGLFVAGGKGNASRKTPSELEEIGRITGLDTTRHIYASRMSAKVDNTALKDGYQLYHHTFLITTEGSWAVIQQGMNASNRYARRYHWLSDSVTDFVSEPHAAICCDRTERTLNLVAQESAASRKIITELSHLSPAQTLTEIKKIQTLHLPSHHAVDVDDIHPDRLHKALLSTYERQPESFEALLGISGVGPKTVRALALIGELLYGAPASIRDPVRFSFAHGGKDGHPYPVDRPTYERSIETLRRAVDSAKIGHTEKRNALKTLYLLSESTPADRSVPH
ncbi:MAG: DUF763 domain-containing protein [Nitrospirae bacterium]|nr:DUF763 domain-containing protein [Candidatus Manganitrophaceae bacterium]